MDHRVGLDAEEKRKILNFRGAIKKFPELFDIDGLVHHDFIFDCLLH
jgi:hypothetical protein